MVENIVRRVRTTSVTQLVVKVLWVAQTIMSLAHHACLDKRRRVDDLCLRRIPSGQYQISGLRRLASLSLLRVACRLRCILMESVYTKSINELLLACARSNML